MTHGNVACLHIGLDRILERLRFRAADAVDLLSALPEVERGEGADTLTAHELVGRRAAVSHDLRFAQGVCRQRRKDRVAGKLAFGHGGEGSMWHLDKFDIGVLLAELVKFRRDYFARAAPARRVVHHQELVACRSKCGIELLSARDVVHDRSWLRVAAYDRCRARGHAPRCCHV